jgi:hypothetical protein
MKYLVPLRPVQKCTSAVRLGSGCSVSDAYGPESFTRGPAARGACAFLDAYGPEPFNRPGTVRRVCIFGPPPGTRRSPCQTLRSRRIPRLASSSAFRTPPVRTAQLMSHTHRTAARMAPMVWLTTWTAASASPMAGAAVPVTSR